MRFVFYVHSLASCWNHGNAHFQRGVMRDLVRRGHEVMALEPADSWSRNNLERAEGGGAVERFRRDFPELASRRYHEAFEHDAAVEHADVVIVHEWTDPALIATLGRMRRAGGRFTLLFHDTHHRAVSAPEDMAGLDLGGYDAVLAFGAALRERYVAMGWGRRAFVWHEAADTSRFHPLPEVEPQGDLVWVGNWGDDERSREIRSFLIEPARQLGLSGRVHGVRYPAAAIGELRSAGLDYAGWVANADVPHVFARHRVTVHIPRRPYVEMLPGIPTIRVFEALACGIPLISAPWRDVENLFRAGQDYLVATDSTGMRRALRSVLAEPARAAELTAAGRQTIESAHTCRHRVDELLDIVERVGGRRAAARPLQEAAQ